MSTPIATQRGFSLVEMIVAVGIFSIVMVVSMGTLIVLVSASNVAQKTLATSTNLSFALDAISRNIRTGYDYYCTNSPNVSLQTGTRDCAGNAAIIFTDGETGDRTAYRFNTTSGSLEQKIEGGSWIPLTSRDVTITDLSFYVTGSTVGDDEQPLVRILMSGLAPNTSLDVAPFYIQTTVVQKPIDF